MEFRTEEALKNKQRIKGVGHAEYLDMLRIKAQEKEEIERNEKLISRADRGEWFRPMPKKLKIGAGIRVIPHLPWMKYQYTCPKCRCHAISKPGISDCLEGWQLVICANCQHTWREYP